MLRVPIHGSLLALVAILGPVLSCRPSTSVAPEPEPEPGSAPAVSTPAATTTEPRADSPAPSVEAGWTMIAQEDGIVVTSRPSEHSPLPVFRGEAQVDAPLLEILAVVIDAQRHHEWVFSCSDSAMIERPSESVGIVYNRTATPWPVPDRDVILESRVEVQKGEQEVLVRFWATEHPEQPAKQGVVRMTYLRGHYHLWAEGSERTRVQYQVDSDPGGRLPTWLATRGTRDMPLETLRGLRTQVVRTRGLYDDQIEQLRATVGRR